MPKIVDKPKRRREIALTAMNLFSKKGFERTSVREIAEVCGIAKGSIYDYFTNKEDILIELVKLALETWQAAILRLKQKSASPAILIPELLVETVEQMASEISGLFMFFGYARQEGTSAQHAELLSAVTALSNETSRTFAEWLERGRRDGIFPNVSDPAADAALLISAIDGISLRHRNGLEPRDLAQGLHRFLDVFLEGLSA
jgi:TetR/AcrR family transcriptional regulator, cholesterol catabolism regulator